MALLSYRISWDFVICYYCYPLLFAVIMEAISREFRVNLPWEPLYRDD